MASMGKLGRKMYKQLQQLTTSEQRRLGRYIATKLAQVQQEQRRKLEYERNKKPVICDTIQPNGI
jgi:hypothetical protein